MSDTPMIERLESVITLIQNRIARLALAHVTATEYERWAGTMLEEVRERACEA